MAEKDEGPPDGCLCAWAHYDDDRGWIRKTVDTDCPIHNELKPVYKCVYVF